MPRPSHTIDQRLRDKLKPVARQKFVIEVDGAVHQKQEEADLEREQILKGLGYRIFYFTNYQVLEETAQVLQKVLLSLP